MVCALGVDFLQHAVARLVFGGPVNTNLAANGFSHCCPGQKVAATGKIGCGWWRWWRGAVVAVRVSWLVRGWGRRRMFLVAGGPAAAVLVIVAVVRVVDGVPGAGNGVWQREHDVRRVDDLLSK